MIITTEALKLVVSLEVVETFKFVKVVCNL